MKKRRMRGGEVKLFTFRYLPSIIVDERIELIQAAIHHFHANHHISLAKQSSIEVNRVRTIAGSHRNVEIHEQTFLSE